jgi:hypothetical protein
MRKPSLREKAFDYVAMFVQKEPLELVFVLIPELIVFIFRVVFLPLLGVLFLPFVCNGCVFARRIGCAACIGIDLYRRGTTITFI